MTLRKIKNKKYYFSPGERRFHIYRILKFINQLINISFIQKGTLQKTSKYSYSYTVHDHD